MEEDDGLLPNDLERLKLLVADLTRRLQNAQHSIEAERTIAQNAMAQAQMYRQRMDAMANTFRLENEKNIKHERDKILSNEAQKYEANRERSSKLHQELRLMEIDHQMTRNKSEPLKMTKLRSKIEKIETDQNSQKLLLLQMGELDKLNEELAIAVQTNDLERTVHLVKCGASVNHTDVAGFSSLHSACSHGNYSIAKFLLEFGADSSSYLTGHPPLVTAASRGHLDIVKLLLTFGAKVEDKGVGGCTALLSSILSGDGNFDVFDYLLTYAGADINASDHLGSTALHHVIHYKDLSISCAAIPYLIHKGIDTNMVDQKGRTALQIVQYEIKIKEILRAFASAMPSAMMPLVQTEEVEGGGGGEGNVTNKNTAASSAIATPASSSSVRGKGKQGTGKTTGPITAKRVGSRTLGQATKERPYALHSISAAQFEKDQNNNTIDKFNNTTTA